jgi:hypothetical protein
LMCSWIVASVPMPSVSIFPISSVSVINKGQLV